MNKVTKTPKKVYFDKITLKEGVTAVNFYAFSLFSIGGFFTGALIEISKVMLLTGK